ncbi:hypothetical protein Klosneuvirus_2_41 [Klosneuvirus KNV1]|uniref:Uncharacterized protein n=1 Tax=Klosneuvirus KNV1 TaxID=1977640 RepID=A0A1V0SIR0_9VIRU|nr:hypothetical protein Klosneuvirus_2_41 [Klosneuvirus KNV1]
MTDVYLWRVYCITEGQYVTTVSATMPTTCPNNAGHTIDSTATVIMESLFNNIYSDGYINIQSALADNQAIKIRASDTNGGIDIDAGLGGIAVDTTNSISLDAAAASNFTTSMGNLTLEATAGLVTIDGGSGLTIGNGSTTTPIYIGTSLYTKDVEIGNNSGSTLLALRSGTGGISVNSVKTASNAIDIYSAGGIAANAAGLINIASGNNTVSAITLDASSGGGGMVLTSGAQGIILTSNGGPLALGSWSGGDLYLGTAAVARSISVGNSTGSTTITANSGTGGTTISSTGIVNLSSTNTTTNAITLDSSGSTGGIVLTSGTQGIYLSSNSGPIALGSFTGGDIYIGTASVARTINIGNTTSSTALVLSAGTGGIAIGNDSSTGEIQVGKTTNAKVITVGNSTGTSRLFNRFGTGGFIKHQSPAISLSDADATLTITDILKSIFTIIPTVDRTLTLPTAALAVAGISGVEADDAIEFTIINKSTSANEAHIIIASGTGGSIDGNDVINPKQNNVGSYFTSGSGTFRMSFTNVTGGSEAYVVYRIS